MSSSEQDTLSGRATASADADSLLCEHEVLTRSLLSSEDPNTRLIAHMSLRLLGLSEQLSELRSAVAKLTKTHPNMDERVTLLEQHVESIRDFLVV